MSAGRKNNSPIKNWNTPPKIVLAVKEFWGEVALDPCSNEHSLVGAKKKFSGRKMVYLLIGQIKPL